VLNSNFQELTVSLKKLKIAVKKWGDPKGKPILALHGWLDNAGTFDRLAPRLEKYQIFAVDLPGHGLSGHWPEEMSYHSLDAVKVVAQLVAHWNWDQFILMGHSMGAGMGCLYAGTFPEKIEQLILIEGLGPLAATPQEGPPRLKRSILQHAELHSKRLPVYLSVEEAIRVRGKASAINPETVAPIVHRGLKEVPGGFTWRTDPRLKMESPFRMTEEQVCAFLEAIICPVLWIRANQGMDFAQFMSPHRPSAVKNLKTFQLDGSHHVHLESHELLSKEIKNFLENSTITF
jgi:pimeloyl-ACP methyl ester carboxylesterase